MAFGAGSHTFRGVTWAIFLVMGIVVAILWMNGTISTNYFNDHFVYSTIKINATTFNVHVARTPAEQTASLNGVASISDTEGMLFVFDKDGIYSISTTDMRFPIDIMWINSSGNIVDAMANVAPGLRDPVQTREFARYVLMVNAGVMDHNDITTHTSADLGGIR